MIIQTIPTKHIMWQNQDNHLNKESKTKPKEYKSYPISREDIELGIKTLPLTESHSATNQKGNLSRFQFTYP